MKKISFVTFMFFAVLTGFMSSCNNDDDDPEPVTPDQCASSTFPPNTGTATVSFVNFTTDNNADGIIDVNAAAGDYLSIAVQINKGSGTRPQKLRVYQTDCANVLGTNLAFPGQPKTEDQDKTFDLANTDQQVRTVLYLVPTGAATLYLNFEVDESNSKYTYKRIKLNISGSGTVDSYTGIQLGGNTNPLASRMSSSTGYVYKACETEHNIGYIDITYAVSGTPTSYISSNPARFVAPIGLTTTTASGCEETVNTNGGNPTYFKVNTTVNFDAITDAELSALTVSSSNNQYAEVNAVGDVFEFLTTNGRKGLIKVTAIDQLDNPAGSITISVKVQR